MTTENSQLPQSGPAKTSRPSSIGIVIGILVLVLIALVLFLVARYLLPAPTPQNYGVAPIPQPARQTQLAEVSGYGWVSKPTGAARIPVDRAMQIIATK